MKQLTHHLRNFVILFLATFFLIQCKQDKNISNTKVQPTPKNTYVVKKADGSIMAVTDLEFKGRVAYYIVDTTITETDEKVVGIAATTKTTHSLKTLGSFKGYVNLYSARLPVKNGTTSLEVNFATTGNLLENQDYDGLDPVTEGGPFTATLFTTNQFLLGSDEKSGLPDSIYVFNRKGMEQPDSLARIPPPTEKVTIEKVRQ